MLEVNLKKLNNNAVVPTKGSDYSAGYDLYACLDEEFILIKPGEVVKVPTGIAVEIPNGYVGLIFARSGLAINKNLAPVNKVGVCDSDYRGEYLVALLNSGKEEVKIKNKDRIAQLVIVPILSVKFKEVASLTETKRGEGGFGSTGI